MNREDRIIIRYELEQCGFNEGFIRTCLGEKKR